MKVHEVALLPLLLQQIADTSASFLMIDTMKYGGTLAPNTFAAPMQTGISFLFIIPYAAGG